MTRIRRITCALLTVALLLCLMPAASATALDAFTDGGDIRNNQAVTMLTELGVVSGFPDGSFRPEDYVTREQAAKMIAAILQRKDGSFTWDGAPTFTDSSLWADAYIEYCAYKGIIAGYSDGSFDPLGNITAVQMFKMLLVAIGRDPVPYTGDDWEQNVVDDAIALGLFDGYTGSTPDELTRDNACLLIFNALKCLVITGYDGSGEPVYSLDDLMNPITVLEYYFDVKMYTEIVTGNEFADLTTSNSHLERGKTKIAGHREFDISTGMEYLGRQVNIYLTAEGKILGEPVFSEQDLVMTFNSGAEFDNYYVFDLLTMNDDTEYYLNYNKTTFSVIGELDDNSRITVIDRNGDGAIDVMLVTQYKTVTIKGKTDQGWTLEEDIPFGGILDFDLLYDPDVTFQPGETVKAALIGGAIHVLEE